MLYSYNNISYCMYKSKFLNNPKLAVGNFGTYVYGGQRTQNIASAIGFDKHLMFRKLYGEYLERFRIGINASGGIVKTLNIIDGTIKTRKRIDLSYGYNPTFGYVDTTGSASGTKSLRVIEKAFSELIEKNEMFLMWYSKFGYILIFDESVIDILNRYGLSQKETVVFLSNQLSNAFTIAVVIFEENKVISVGISLNKNEKQGLVLAIEEAILLKEQNLDESVNVYNKILNQEEYVDVYSMINYFKTKFKPIFLKDLRKYNKIEVESFIKNVEVCVLNVSPNQESITIRCISEDLFNCIPLKHYVLKSNNNIKTIFQITDKQINQMLPNIFI